MPFGDLEEFIMSKRSVLLAAALILIGVGLFPGCSGNNQTSQTSTIPIAESQGPYAAASSSPMPAGILKPALPKGSAAAGWLSSETKNSQTGPLLYVAGESANEVLIYPESGYNQFPIGMITSGVQAPFGLYVDESGNLYVANQDQYGGTGRVTVYPPGAIYPSATYSQDLTRPLFMIVDHYGDLFVGNGESLDGSGGTVVEYLAGSTNAYQVLQLPGNEADGMDFDQQGNLYVAYRAKGAAGIEKFPPGSTQGQSLGIKLANPAGLIVDRAGNIAVAANTNARAGVLFFRAGAQTTTFALGLPGNNRAVQLATTADERMLFVSSYTNANVYVTQLPLTRKSTLTLLDHASVTIQGMALSNGQTF
ncbi:MAG: hypothetical protein WBE83_03615 [Candidatus Cybelea sp.]